jgi:hypothetical protein
MPEPVRSGDLGGSRGLAETTIDSVDAVDEQLLPLSLNRRQKLFTFLIVAILPLALN